MKIRIVLALCAVLAACGKTQDDNAAAKASIISEVSGIWSSSSAGLITIDYRAGRLHFLIADDPKVAKLGDVDIAKRSVNLLLRHSADGGQIVWTLHRVWDANRTSFHLDVALDNGTHAELPFVRKISAADAVQIASLYPKTSRHVAVNPAPVTVNPVPEAEKPSPPQDDDATIKPAAMAPPVAPVSKRASRRHADTAPEAVPVAPVRNIREHVLAALTPQTSAASDTDRPSVQQSFDCASPLVPVEQIVCGDTLLVAEDSRMQALLTAAQRGPYAREARAGQRYWRNAVRNRCLDDACMRYAYARRIEELNALMTGARRGENMPAPDSLSVVREFYRALGRGDGEAAAALVVPERRDGGSLSAEELGSFRGQLASQFALDGIDPSGGNNVIARYRYVTREGRVCAGYSFVRVVERDGMPMIANIAKANGC